MALLTFAKPVRVVVRAYGSRGLNDPVELLWIWSRARMRNTTVLYPFAHLMNFIYFLDRNKDHNSIFVK